MGLISPTTTALAPSRTATSRAVAGSSGRLGSWTMRPSASLTVEVPNTLTTGDCAMSIRKASVTDWLSVESAVWLAKSATISLSRAASLPEATRVPTGPIPSSRIAVYTTAHRASTPNAR
jgi:hypothetical protein